MMNEAERRQLAESVRAECLRAALAAYESARMDGLCDDGAFEVAIDAVRALGLDALSGAQPAEGRP